MKRILLTGLFFVLTINMYSFYGLKMLDPRASWSTQNGTIEEASLSVKPRGVYLEYGLYLTFSARGTSWHNKSDSLEIVLDFELPDKSLIIDSWLWIGNEISKARILDKWTASSIYENIVKRRTDPSILTKNGSNQYQLKVFPMAGNQTRKVKITYLVPVTWVNDNISAPIPYAILRSSKFDPTNLYVFAWDNLGFSNPVIKGSKIISFNEYNNTEFGIHHKAAVPVDIYQTPLTINFESAHTNGLFISKTKYKNENFYQLALLPEKLINFRNKRKILFLVDYDFTKSINSKFIIMEELKTRMLSTLNPEDSFNIMVSNFEISKYSNNWEAASPSNINDAVTKMVSRIGDLSNLGSLLVQGLNFTQKSQGNSKVFLLANSSQYDDYQVANILLKDLMKLLNYKTTIHIADFQTKFTYWQNVNGVYYSGNEYLYVNLSKLTFGSFNSTRENITEMMVIEKAFGALSGNINSVDFHTSMSNGYCFGRMFFDDANVFSSNMPIVQVGKFLGDGAFEMEFSGQTEGDFFTSEFTVEMDDVYETDSTLAKIWNGRYIYNLENEPNKSNQEINDLIFKSIDSRVLSQFTAFLCLEDTSYYCLGCKDETELVGSEEIFIGTDSISIFPNPFHDMVDIEVLTGNPGQILSLSIYDLNGKLVYDFDKSLFTNEKEYKITWDGYSQSGSEVKKGLYILICKTAKNVITKRILKT
ncbi:MAG: VIT domain-containing protein [Deltaproteobacteria bacterium]